MMLGLEIGSPEMWVAVDSVALAVIATLGFLSSRKQAKSSKARDVKIQQVGAAVHQVSRQVNHVQNAINAPLTEALATNARLSLRIAQLPGATAEDLDAAMKAQTAYEECVKKVMEGRADGSSDVSLSPTI